MATSAQRKIVPFPIERVARAAAGGATQWQVWRGRLREKVGYALCWLRIPGAIANSDIKDTVTGQEISVAVGTQYVRLSVDGRDYYFDRLTGRFDGTGTSP